MVPRRAICPTTLRRIFNALELDAAVRSGALSVHVLRDGLTPADREQVPGTRSQFVRYTHPDGEVVAMAFRYVRPDGTLGASGLPDPKWLLVGGEALIPFHEPHSCDECARR